VVDPLISQMFKSSWNPFKKEDPKELVRKWKGQIRTDMRSTDREIQSLLMEQKKAATAIKEAAKRNDMVSAKVRTATFGETRSTAA